MKVENLEYVTALFERKGWPMSLQYIGGKKVIDQICELLAVLSEEEKCLVKILLNDYLACNFQSYPVLLEKVLKQIPPNMFQGVESVFVCPLVLKKEDIEWKGQDPRNFRVKVKSPDTLLYPAPEILKSFDVYPNGLKVEALGRVSLLSERIGSPSNSLVILVDDYIGSGNTALSVLQFLKSFILSSNDKICIVSLVGQKIALDMLRSQGIAVFADTVRTRGISDSQVIQNKQDALNVMKSIEVRLGTNANYHFGYKATEALVTMIRTPNNTFPIFWKTDDAHKRPWPAAFPRSKS